MENSNLRGRLYTNPCQLTTLLSIYTKQICKIPEKLHEENTFLICTIIQMYLKSIMCILQTFSRHTQTRKEGKEEKELVNNVVI